MSNPIYDEWVLKQQEKYHQARKDCLDAVHSVEKAMKSFNELTPQQKDELISDLARIGTAMQCPNCLNQKYGMG